MPAFLDAAADIYNSTYTTRGIKYRHTGVGSRCEGGQEESVRLTGDFR